MTSEADGALREVKKVGGHFEPDGKGTMGSQFGKQTEGISVVRLISVWYFGLCNIISQLEYWSLVLII